MSRSYDPDFKNLTYSQYFEKYSITSSSPAPTQHYIYYNNLSNYVVKRTKEILTRYRFLTIDDEEPYFYQQLLLKVLAKNKSDYKITSNTPSEVVAQNIESKTIHSELCIVSTQEGFQTCFFIDKELKTYLQKVNTIIIDEISM
ncbi:3933_t:CDS:2, partial [Gigaspora margarita]